MELEIQTHNTSLVFDMLEKKSVSVGDTTNIPGGANLTYKGSFICKSIGIPETVNFAITFGSSVVAGVVANWIYDKLNGKTVKLTINRQEIQLDKEEIKRVVEETIKIEK